jgi:hypothetical protein
VSWRIDKRLAYSPFSCYIYLMSFSQTVEILASRRLIIDVPPEVPAVDQIIRLYYY